MAQTIITLDELQKSAHTYERQLLQMPVIAAEDTLKHMTPMPGLFGRHTLTEITGQFELGPYKRDRWADGQVTLTPRTIETFLGNNALNFDPNELYGTIFGERVFKGEAVKATQIARDILSYMAAQLGRSLNMAIWGAKRDDSGDTTATLFNGFDTITEEEVEAGSIAAANGNYVELADEITAENAVDIFQSIYESASDELQGVPVNIYCTKDQYRKYLKAYKAETGAAVYNDSYEKTTLEGSDGLATFVPLVSKKGSSYIHIAPRRNLVFGYGNGLPNEGVSVEKYKPWEFTLEAALVFGVQFASVSKEALMVAKTAASA